MGLIIELLQRAEPGEAQITVELILVLRRHVRYVEAVPVHIVLEAVIYAAYSALLIAPVEQRHTEMRASVVHDPHFSRIVSELSQGGIAALSQDRFIRASGEPQSESILDLWRVIPEQMRRGAPSR